MKLTKYSKALTCALSISFIHGSKAISFDNVEHTLDTLQTWYNSTYGLWVPSSGWWNSANCLTTLATLAAIDNNIKGRLKDLWQDIYTKAPAYNALMTQSLGPHWRRGLSGEELLSVLGRRPLRRRDSEDVGFINGYYDDEGWWALAWIAVYDVTKDQKYLNEAVTIFNDMNAAYNTTPLGGLWWDKDRTYVNSIVNELYFSVAAHLANRCPSEKSRYIGLAQASWNWLYASGLINNHNNFVDGLNISEWRSNMAIVWSYNQGVILGALTELSQATGQFFYTAIAKTFADAALMNITNMTVTARPNLILHDPCEPNCGVDGSSFKGIFARNLAKLHSASPQDRYAEFLIKNAEAIWQNNRDPSSNELGLVWAGPFIAPGNAGTQCSAMDVLVGALAQLGEWEGNGTYVGGEVISQGQAGGGQAWDSVSWLESDSGGDDNTQSKGPRSVASRAGRARGSFFGLW